MSYKIIGRGVDEVLGRTEEGNIQLGVICRDVLYFVFKELEKENLGMIIKLIGIQLSIHWAVIAFMDDIDFYTSYNLY